MSKMRLVYDESMNRLYLVNLARPDDKVLRLNLNEPLTGWDNGFYINFYFTDEYIASDEFIIEEWED
jgi:PhoPQ-activated pathogenicity-related protein